MFDQSATSLHRLPTRQEFVQNARDKSEFAAREAAAELAGGRKKEARRWSALQKKFDELVREYGYLSGGHG